MRRDATYYTKVMERVQSKGDAFITSEIERLNRLLGKISLHLNLHKLHLKHFLVNLVAKKFLLIFVFVIFMFQRGPLVPKRMMSLVCATTS